MLEQQLAMANLALQTSDIGEVSNSQTMDTLKVAHGFSDLDYMHVFHSWRVLQ